MTYRIVHILHVVPVRSSVASDLIYSAPKALVVEGCEFGASGLGAVLQRDKRADGVQRLGVPPRGTFDLWDAGAQVIVEDHLPRTGLDVLHNTELQATVGLICARPADAGAMPQIGDSATPEAWHVLWLIEDRADAMPPPDLGPAVPIAFHYRESGTAIIRPTNEATREGRALWSWLAPKLRLDPPFG
jgi:hypothetical protein